MFFDFLNLFFAWLPAVLILLLSVIYPLRLYIRRKQLQPNNLIFKVNKLLRKVHKGLGVLAIALTFLHCRISSQKLGMNIGTICLVLLILLWCTYFLRKKLKMKWIVSHRYLTFILILVLIAHILITRFTNINI